MILNRYLKNKTNENFSPYKDIKLDDVDIKHINKVPHDVMDKLYQITEMEMGKKVLDGKLSVEEAKGAILYSKYLRTYFNK